jgi:hypothetical protein
VNALVALLLLAAPAPDARWGLRWQAPKECIQPADLARAVEDKLGRQVFGPSPEFTVDGVMRAGTSPKWRAQFTLVDASGAVQGTREVTSEQASCTAMDSSLALIVAVMIDPRVALGGAVVPETSTPPMPEPAPPPAVEPKPEPRPPPKEIPRAEIGEDLQRPLAHGSRGEVLFGTSGSLGLGVSAALAAQITVHVRWGQSAAVEWWAGLIPRNETYREGGLAAVHTLQTALTLCPVRAEGGPVLFVLCGGVAGTLMLTYTEGYKQGTAGFLARPDAVARARLRLGLGTFALSLGVMGAIGPVRPVMFVMQPNGNSELLPVGSWGWGAVELAVGALWR